MDRNERESVARRTLLKSVPAMGLLGFAGCTSNNGNSDNNNGNSDTVTWTLGANAQGSGFWTLSQALTKLYRQHSDRLRVSPQSTSGAKANYEQFARNQNDLTGTSGYILKQAYNQTGPYNGQKLKPVPLQGWTFAFTNNYFTAPKGSGIETYEDMRGKNVWPFYPGSSLRAATEEVFKAFGIWNDINTLNMGTDEIPGAIEEGRVDAAGSTGLSKRSVPGWNTQVDARANMHALTMSDKKQQTLKDVDSVNFSRVSPYGWDQDLGVDTVASWGSNFMMIYNPDLDPDLVYHSMKVMENNFQQVYDSAKLLVNGKKNPELYTQGILPDFPISKGIARFFKEKDVMKKNWVVGLDDWNKNK